MVESTNRTIFAAVEVQKEKCQIPSNLYMEVVKSTKHNPACKGTSLSSYKTSNPLHPVIWEKRCSAIQATWVQSMQNVVLN